MPATCPNPEPDHSTPCPKLNSIYILLIPWLLLLMSVNLPCAGSSHVKYQISCPLSIPYVVPNYQCRSEVRVSLGLGSCDRASWANCEEREKTNMMQQSDVCYQHCLNKFRALLCPSSGEQDVCYCMWCAALVPLDVVCSGCGSFPMWRRAVR